MAKVHFTSNLRRHVDCPAVEVAASQLHEALDQAFAKNERLKTLSLIHI